MLEPVVNDMTVLWENFDEALTSCKEKCNSALIQLIENVRSDLNGTRPQSSLWATRTRTLTVLIRNTRGRSRTHASILGIHDGQKGTIAHGG